MSMMGRVMGWGLCLALLLCIDCGLGWISLAFVGSVLAFFLAGYFDVVRREGLAHAGNTGQCRKREDVAIV